MADNRPVRVTGEPASPPPVGSARRLSRVALRHRYPIQAALDALLWPMALVAAGALRFELDIARVDWGGLVVLSVIAGAVQLGAGLLGGLYLGRWQYGSFEEIVALVRTTFLALVIAMVVNQLPDGAFTPTSVVIAAGAFTIVAQAAVRYTWRLLLERSRRPDAATARRVIVAGAGLAGEQLIRSMLADPTGGYLPVALVDDDPSKARLSIKGVTVEGGLDAVCAVAGRARADAVVIAIPSAGADLVRSVTATAQACDLQALVLPSLVNLSPGPVDVGDVRPVAEVDLLGRRVIDTDVGAVADYLRDRRVLVTGAGGSIGSELCRQIATFEPASLVMVDHDESALHAVQLALAGRAMLDTEDVVVADIRDRDRLRCVFEQHRPEVVFHAAALKHLTLLERFPDEAVKTNVWGTLNVLDAADAAGVERVVNVSTDKAADPTSVLGYTKRVAECLTAGRPGHAGPFVSVRFGNVLGSRGSVLTAFRAQIDAGGPVTVTDPDVTRYFMLAEEAVQLVIQAGALDVPDGAALVLDMGEPVAIQAVAEALIGERREEIDIVHTGLRPGEKLHEVLHGEAEVPEPTSHPDIAMVSVPRLAPEQVQDALVGVDDLTGRLRLLCATSDTTPRAAGGTPLAP